ncbi:hypothetical protein EBZ38_12175 [bacterium]|nr:hypothetical protein [bacterium]
MPRDGGSGLEGAVVVPVSFFVSAGTYTEVCHSYSGGSGIMYVYVVTPFPSVLLPVTVAPAGTEVPLNGPI